MREKILGSLAAFAIGDAMGAPAQELSISSIRKLYGKLEFMCSPKTEFPMTVGMKAGQVTDDTIMMMATGQILTQSKGDYSPANMGALLGQWARNNPIWRTSPMFGPTTRSSLLRLANRDNPIEVGTRGSLSNEGVTDGAAMRIPPVGLIFPGDLDRAVAVAVALTVPTHGTTVAISAATSVAAAVAAAMQPDADLFSVIRAGIYGARRGWSEAESNYRTVSAPRVDKRIVQAVSIVLETDNVFEASELIADTIGTGIHAAEAVPAAFGLLVAAGGDPNKAAIAGANCGGDTDTIAAIAGSIAGALKGMGSVNQEWFNTVVTVNELDLEEMAISLESLAYRSIAG